MMDTIYEGAFATIVALNGASANDGLAGVTGRSERSRQVVAHFGANMMIDTLPSLRQEVNQSTYRTRAWTHQKPFLSRRRLIFTKHQLHFVCNQMACCESRESPMSTRDQKESKKLPPADIADPRIARDLTGTPEMKKFETYEVLVQTFLAKRLSDDNDSLNAILGLLRYLTKNLFTEGFLYGLPRAHFRRSILWRQDSSGRKNVTTTRTAADLPSWSWATWKMRSKFSMPLSTVLLAKSHWNREERGTAVPPPLHMQTCKGQHLSIDSPNEEDRMSTLGMINEEVQEANMATLEFYTSVQSQYLQDLSSRSTESTALKDYHLRVEGILLSFYCGVRSRGIAKWSSPFLNLPDDFEGRDAISVKWFIDGNVEDVAPSVSETVVHFHQPDHASVLSSHFDRLRKHDFLLVQAVIGAGGLLRLEVLHLIWLADGVAIRQGVLVIQFATQVKSAGYSQLLKGFWKWCDARRCRFWLA